jgi:hypothetical protein
VIDGVFTVGKISSKLRLILGALLALSISACETANLAGPDPDVAQATLQLLPMDSSQNSTVCVINALDGKDVTKDYSRRLTTEFILPAGQHTYRFSCEDSVGSIAVRDYLFDLTFSLDADAVYGLMQGDWRTAYPCIVVAALDDAAKNDPPLAGYCPQ